MTNDVQNPQLNDWDGKWMPIHEKTTKKSIHSLIKQRQVNGKGLPILQKEIYTQEIEYVDMELTGKPVPR